MTQSRLFQYAAILHPTEKQAENGARSELIVEVQTVLASDEDTALLIAARQIDEEYLDALDRVELVVRPF
jgi:hypothetical protein